MEGGFSEDSSFVTFCLRKNTPVVALWLCRTQQDERGVSMRFGEGRESLFVGLYRSKIRDSSNLSKKKRAN